MKKTDNDERDVIDKDLYEEIDEQELREILEEERIKSQKMEAERENKPKRPFPKWAFWLIAIAMLINVIAFIPKTFSIPAIDFLITSAKLSQNEKIDNYQESVVVIEAGKSKGTGFSVAADGLILTNHHVIEDEKTISVAFPEEGLYDADVVAQFPNVDLAVLDVSGENLPFLDLAKSTEFEKGEHIYFIGNPLRFQGIANEGSTIGYTKLDNWNEKVFMLEAPVYRGNSGSPVINENGKVIGVVFATLDHDSHGKVGLAIPIDYFYEKYDFEASTP